MNSAWLPALVSVIASGLGYAAIWGALGQKVKDHDERLEKLDGKGGVEERQWHHIGKLDAKLANVRGRLGLNGE